jgi:hypothetical protein
LEDILLECADTVYPELKTKSRHYLSGISDSWKASWRRSDANKVHVGCISNVLKPGKTNQASISDNDWISSATTNISKIVGIVVFLHALLQ